MVKSYKFALQEMPPKDIEWVQLIRSGKFNHALHGSFDITQKVLQEFKHNFDRKARRVDIPIDYFHKSNEEAAGWVKEVELRDDENQLWVKVDWTDQATDKIKSKEIRYISADFTLDYTDSETGIQYGATLFGAGLTNRPHVKDMQAIFCEKQLTKEKQMADFKEIMASLGNLSDDEKMQLGEKLGLKAMDKTLSDAKEALKLAEADALQKDEGVKKLSDEVGALKAQLAEKEKDNAFTKMLTEGKVVEAQRDAYMKSDMVTFAENAMSINLEGQGNSGGGGESDGDNVAATKLNEIATSKAKEKGILLSDAYKEACNENPKLAMQLSQ